MDDETLILIEYIKNAPTRKKVLKSFEGEDSIRPIEISRKTGIHPNNVSKKLKDLREHELVYIINPEYHVPKLYRLTERGSKILKLLEWKYDFHKNHRFQMAWSEGEKIHCKF